MKKIIDVNFIRDPELTHYLQSDKRNFIVFSDYAWMETYKGNVILNFSELINILSPFINQIIILKKNYDIWKLPFLADEQTKFVDIKSTMNLKKFFHDVKRVVEGDILARKQIKKTAHKANEFFNGMMRDTQHIVQGSIGFMNTFAPNQLRLLRTRKGTWPNELITKIKQSILTNTESFLKMHPEFTRMPQKFPDGLAFRLAISAYALLLKQIADGGISKKVNLENLRNDHIDMYYVAYATFYDGILTNDTKMMELYKDACVILEKVFDIKPGIQYF